MGLLDMSFDPEALSIPACCASINFLLTCVVLLGYTNARHPHQECIHLTAQHSTARRHFEAEGRCTAM
jgi:hypothetical protein